MAERISDWKGAQPESGGQVGSVGAKRSQHSLERRAIARAKEGDWDAIHFLYVEYFRDIHAYVRSIVRDHHAAEDIAQNIFVKLITAIRKYEDREIAFAAWLFRVARNASLDYMRAHRQIPVEEVRISDERDQQLDLHRREALIDGMAQLPCGQQEVLMLRHIGGFTPGEIATKLGKSEGSIHGLHHRGRAALKRYLREVGAAPISRSL
jgi:RNA polymerase sigma-70 factor (ECF subfamily)